MNIIPSLVTHSLDTCNRATEQIQTLMKDLDSQSPASAVQLQYLVFQYTFSMNSVSTLVKDFKDLISSVMAKI